MFPIGGKYFCKLHRKSIITYECCKCKYFGDIKGHFVECLYDKKVTKL